MIITYLDVRDSVVAQMKKHFAVQSNIHIAAHPGMFNEEEIRRLATRTPAILTSLVRISERDADDESFCDFVSWVLYRANNRDTLYDGALKIVSALIPVIQNLDAEWCIDGGRELEAECLYSGSLDKINITLWAIKWRWHLRGAVTEGQEGGILLPDDLDYFEGYDAGTVVDRQEIKDEVHLEVNHGSSDGTNSG
ncbi:MAG: hypothetical protein LBJ24_02355 [Treponema sp.]|jgi:hypothetical protein|nr:hypothetical protein [Treponema sp.]